MSEQNIQKGNVKISTEPEKRYGTSGSEIQEHKACTPVPVSGTDEAPVEIQEESAPNPLEEAERLASENRDRWLRAVAELENFKKRSLQEKSKLLKYRNEELLRDLLGIRDNLQRAVSHGSAAGRTDGLMDGLKIVSDMFKDVLTKYGVTEIEAIGKPFDPQFQEALSKVKSPGTEPNLVVEELEKGYLYHDRLLRPAKVVISA